MVRVAVSGSGRMGRQVCEALRRETDLEPVGFVDALAEGGSCDGLPLLSDAGDLLDTTKPDAVVDFTNAAWTPTLVEAALERGVRLVIGTSGLSTDFVDELGRRCADKSVGAVLATNFALGAALMIHFARTAARHYESAEVIEKHHDQKVDSPSGTALTTARAMAEARGGSFARNVPEAEPLSGARAAEHEGVTIHAVRLPGLVAHQEVIFGGLGETLTIRHDTTSRESFMPGVLLAVRRVSKLDHLVVGLDELLGLAAGSEKA